MLRWNLGRICEGVAGVSWNYDAEEDSLIKKLYARKQKDRKDPKD